MTLAQILSGPIAERSNADARNRIPMTAAEVRGIIATMERETKSRAARKRMAQLGASGVGNISAEGRALYAAYAAAL